MIIFRIFVTSNWKKYGSFSRSRHFKRWFNCSSFFWVSGILLAKSQTTKILMFCFGVTNHNKILS